VDDILHMVLIFLIFIIASCNIALLLYMIHIHIKQSKERLTQERYIANINTNIDQTIPAILELIINDCFTDYQLMILIPKNELYITDEREKEIRHDLISKVAERLSKESLDRLSLFYNIRNIDKIIADKIYIIVMNYVISHNRVIPSPEKEQ